MKVFAKMLLKFEIELIIFFGISFCDIYLQKRKTQHISMVGNILS